METRQILYSYFNREFPSNSEGLQEFVDSFDLKYYKKNDLLLTPESKDRKLRFLAKGAVREYYAENEREANIMFYTTPEFITDFSHFDHQAITHKWQQALTDIELLVLNNSKYQELLKRYPCGKSYIETTLRKIIDEKEAIEFYRLTKTPGEFYKCLIDTKKEWLSQIPQYHIALFLGVSPETLSRIRKRIY